MTTLRNLAIAATAALAVAAVSSSAIAQDKRYTIGSLPEGTTPFLINTAWANAVNKYVPGIHITVSAVGPATRHMILTANGQMDFTMSAPNSHRLLYLQAGYFKTITDGPNLSRKLDSILSYPIGLTNPVVYADSGIETWKDLKDKKVFLGPPSSGAARTMEAIVEAMTDGYKPDVDYEQVKMDWGPAQLAFQDRKFDMWTTITAHPSPAIEQLTLTSKIRILPLDESKFGHPAWKGISSEPGRTVETIRDQGAYGDKLVNEEPPTALGSWVELAANADIPEDEMYLMTKAFWEHIDEAWAMAPFMKSILNLDMAFTAQSNVVHPGAMRYYKEIGAEVPDPLRLTPENADQYR